MTTELSLYALTIAMVSLTPGLCMTLAFTLGMTVGYRRALWMMLGELTGVASVFTATFWSLHWLLDQSPILFQTLSLLGGGYLAYLAFNLFRAPAESMSKIESLGTNKYQLIALGYVTAVSNPKGWAFLLALLPGFISPESSMTLQYGSMLLIMMMTEFSSMSLYAGGGKWASNRFSTNGGHITTQRVAALLLAVTALWVLSGAIL